MRVYRETVSGRVFYRLLLCNERLETLLSCTYKDEKLSFAGEYSEWRSKKIVQIVFARKNDGSLKELAVLPYREHQSTQGSAEGFDFWDLMFKTLGNGEIGFFVTEVSVGYESKYIENDEKFSLAVRKQKGQIAASNRTSFAKYDDDVTYALKDAVSIQASDCLFDPKCPLKYSIQNAFDGNPATSYVENTEDDLMGIVFRNIPIRKDLQVQFSIINGYSLNKNFYEYNNRIKICGIKNGENNPFLIELKDHELISQEKTISRTQDAYTGMFEFVVKDLYRGEKYNDSCIAELNFYNPSIKQWLFGDLNE